MSWVKLDDRFAEHPKVVKAGPLAMAMHVAALCYCNRNGTDGVVPRAIVDRLIDTSGVQSTAQRPDVITNDELATRLVEANIWEQHDDGYAIHDYSDFQPTSDKRAELSEKRREAGRLGAAKRWGDNDKAPEIDATVAATCHKVTQTLVDRFDQRDVTPAVEELRARLITGEAITSPVNIAANLAERHRRARVAEIRKAADEKARQLEADANAGLVECSHGNITRDCEQCREATLDAIAEAKAVLNQ